MYINVGNNLFMPEGDDYSKKEFDRGSEEIELQGNVILQQLRMQQLKMQQTAEQLKKTKPLQEKTSKNLKAQGKEDKKLTYKEILEEVASAK